MSYVGTAVAADDVATIMADVAVLVPFARLLGALFAFFLAVADLLLDLFLLTHLFVDVLSLDLLFFLLLLAGRFFLVTALEVLGESGSWSAGTS